ncbi:MAG: hypothetical protein ACOVRN_13125 [Flavobacterium sp.]
MAGAGFNIVSLSYLFSRLSPFIIVMYFVLQSIFNQNLKGIFYVAGVLLACFLNIILVGDSLGSPIGVENPVCHIIDGMPQLPIGQTILGFTFTYLSYIIIVHKLLNTNSATFVIFPILIISDLIWHYSNKCAPPIALISSLAIGGVFGILWGMIIDQVDPELQFFNGIGNKDICKRPSSTLYKCTVIPKKDMAKA